jgi:hypothetical protein
LPDALSSTCPASVKADDACAVVPTLDCQGSASSATCGGSSSGNQKCRCTSGKWSCYNWSCPSWCPATFTDAKAGPSCAPKASEPGGACYYSDGGPCSCTGGKVSC